MCVEEREFAEAGPESPAAAPAPGRAARPPSRRKLSYREQRELDDLPGRIEALETEQAELQAALADGSLYQSDLERAIALQARDGAIEEELTLALARWTELEAIRDDAR